MSLIPSVCISMLHQLFRHLHVVVQRVLHAVHSCHSNSCYSNSACLPFVRTWLPVVEAKHGGKPEDEILSVSPWGGLAQG